MKKLKYFSLAVFLFILSFSFFNFKITANAASKINDIKSDTTENMNMAVGQKYQFLITVPESSKINYTVGNGNVLKTFVAGNPLKNPDGSVTHCFGFKCLREGNTGIYIRTNSKPIRIFAVKSRVKIKMSDAL